MFILIPLGIDPPEEDGFGLAPAAFPLVAAGLVTALSGLLFATRLPKKISDSDGDLPIPARSWTFLGIISALFAVIFVVFALFGFNYGAPIVVAVFMYIMGERRPHYLIAMAIAVPLVVWMFFWKLLSFPLP